jgi:hypothetical protein
MIRIPLTTYVQDHSGRLADRLRRRHHDTMQDLQALGFQDFTSCGERWFPGSLLIAFPVTIFMLLKGEAITSDWSLRLIDRYPLLYHSAPATHAEITGLGVCYLSSFTDGTVVMSTSTNSDSMDLPALKFVRTAIQDAPPPALWTLHQEQIQRQMAAGGRLRAAPDFQEFVAQAQRYARHVTRNP